MFFLRSGCDQLESISKSGNKTKFEKLIKNHQVKWVFVATPNNTHFNIVKKCLKLK